MHYDREAFYDPIGHVQVNYYTDTFGRRWLATGPWALFRVERHRDLYAEQLERSFREDPE
jgi:hypothetical protein